VDPKKLKRWLIVAAVVYVLFPRDLIPDFLGRGLGFVDDLAFIAGTIWFYRRRLRMLAEFARAQAEGRSEQGEGQGPRERSQREPQAPPSDAESDPYAVLGVPRSASKDEIRTAYRARMQEYHPDKVAHLGEDLQQLAHRKAQEIQRAYEALR
jgi:uncharacterized membrane protein YkvA (DUF1232 family)